MVLKKILLITTVLFILIILPRPSDAEYRATFTTAEQLKAEITLHQHDSDAIYHIVMHANDLRLLHKTIQDYAKLIQLHPHNSLLEAGEGFSKFMEVGPCSYWYIVSRNKWPAYISTLYQKGMNDKHGPFQQPGESVAGCLEIKDALKYNPEDPYVLLMDTIANYFASAFFQFDGKAQAERYRDLSYKYIAMLGYIIKKHPHLYDAVGFYATTIGRIGATFQGTTSKHYNVLELTIFSKMKPTYSYWYDNQFSSELSGCYESAGHPNKAKVLLNYYFTHEVPPQSKFAKQNKKEMERVLLGRLNKEIAAKAKQLSLSSSKK